MKDPKQTVSAIPEYAREFIKVVREKCSQDLDFGDSSIAKLDDVALSWQRRGKNERLAISEGMSFYLGEVIRRNLGGHWVDPRWKNPGNTEARCYLSKVGGVLTVAPSKWVERCLLEGRNESFLSCYQRIKQRIKSARKEATKELSSNARGTRTIEIDKFTSVVTLFQFLVVIMGWVLCRGCTRICGRCHGGLAGFLLDYGYTLVLIPMIWAPLMVYRNASNRIPAFIEKPLSAFGFIAIFGISGLFAWLAVGMLASLPHGSFF